MENKYVWKSVSYPVWGSAFVTSSYNFPFSVRKWTWRFRMCLKLDFCSRKTTKPTKKRQQVGFRSPNDFSNATSVNPAFDAIGQIKSFPYMNNQRMFSNWTADLSGLKQLQSYFANDPLRRPKWHSKPQWNRKWLYRVRWLTCRTFRSADAVLNLNRQFTAAIMAGFNEDFRLHTQFIFNVRWSTRKYQVSNVIENCPEPRPSWGGWHYAEMKIVFTKYLAFSGIS